MKNRILSLILAAIIISVPVLTACTNTTDNKESTGTTAVATDPEIIKIDNYIDDLSAQFNFDGATFTYVGVGDQVAEFEEETGNVENDALYHRQRELEEKFGITWQSKVVGGNFDDNTANVSVAVREAVFAGQNDYDLVYGNPITVGAPLFIENCLIDVSTFETLDLYQEWWESSLEDKYSFAGRMYFLTGAIVSNYYEDPSCILFNKNVLEDYNIDEPYEYVKSGDWTFDKMFDLASAIPLNVSDSGTYRYGNPSGLAILFGHGETMTSFDEDGNPYVESSLPVRFSDIADKFSVIMSDNSQSVHLKGLNNMGTMEIFKEKYGAESCSEMFADGKIFFMFSTTGKATELREKEVEFGIVPIPKGEASQESYYSYADNWASCFVYVPRCAQDLEMTDVIVEAMGALGQKHIKPAYYDKILKNRSVYDSDSKEMIDIVFQNKVYDMADMYAGGNINVPGKFIAAIKYAIDDNSSSFANNYFVYGKLANRKIQQMLKSIEAFE